MNDFLAHKIAYHLDTAAQTLERFRADFDTDPSHAFEWADSAMSAAAKKAVWRKIEAEARKGPFIEEIAAEINEEALSAATFPRSSTSVGATAFQRFRVAALAEAAQELRDFLESQQA